MVVLMTEFWLLPTVFIIYGIILLYTSGFRAPWDDLYTNLRQFRDSEQEDVVIIPDEFRYWIFYVIFGVFILLVGGIWTLLMPPQTPDDFVLTVAMFLFSILLMFGSPLSGSVERTLLVYKTLFAVAGFGFLIDGAYSFVVEGPLLSGLFALLGLFLLYHAFVRMSWEFMREVVEEYRAVEHPSTLGIERITERVQERWVETDTA